jgi:hypothetical protein
MGSGGRRGQFYRVFLELSLRTSLFKRGGGNVTIPTNRHETYGPLSDLRSDYRSKTRDLGAVGTCQKDIYPLLPLCTLSSLALDSQYTTVFALCCSPGFSPVTSNAIRSVLLCGVCFCTGLRLDQEMWLVTT